MATDHLAIPDILANQNGKEVTANAAHNLLDRPMNANVTKAITGDTSFTTTESRENFLIELTGTPGAPHNIDMPDTNKRTMAVFNNTDDVMTIRNSASGGSGQPVLSIGVTVLFHYDGTDFIEFASEERNDWTPVLEYATPGTSSIILSTNDGRYHRIGNKVTLSWSIVTSTFTQGTASGALQISGLPFASAATHVAIGSMFHKNVHQTGATSLVPRISPSGSLIDFVFSSAAADVAEAQAVVADSTDATTVHLTGTITYFVPD